MMFSVKTARLSAIAGLLVCNLSAAQNGNMTLKPTNAPPRAIGNTSNGCIAGAAQLPLEGDGYIAVHLERQRYYGHPTLVQTLKTLAQQTQQAGVGVLQIGDLGQARGGPMPSGHRSHQTGLDADIWFNLDPAVYAQMDAMRANFSAPSMLNAGKNGLNDAVWTAQHVKVLELTAKQATVDRVFVNPYIKRDLCDKVSGDRRWLQKIRPWYHHDDHFHLRLHCPADSPDCEAQEPIPAGDGCGSDLAWWFEEHVPASAPPRVKPPLPKACEAVLQASD